MRLFNITLRSKWGESFVVTLPGRDLEEVLLRIVLDPDWIVGSYSILEVSA